MDHSQPHDSVPAFIDEHSIPVAAPPERVWPALRAYVDALGFPETGPAARLVAVAWAPEPRAGFAIVEESEGREVALAGRHRYSDYRLVFTITPAGDGSVLTARSYGDFPGWSGRAYRALVVGTRGHVVAVRRMLRAIRDRVT